MRFTDEQLAAIYADNPELLVSAAAGSGKTSVLVERILRLITDKGLSVNRMLVVTFTRAAAAELRERLELRLADAAQADARLIRQGELVANAQISTIHGYCQQVVREHFERCRIDPQFMICEPAARERLFNECLEASLDEAYVRAKDDAELQSLLQKFTDRELADMLPPLYDFLLSRPDPMDWLRDNSAVEWSEQALCASPAARVLISEASLRVDGALARLNDARELAKRPCFPKPYEDNIASDALALDELASSLKDDFSSVIAAFARAKFSTLKRFKPETDDEADAADAYKSIRGDMKELIAGVKKLLPQSLEDAAGDMAQMSGASAGLYKLALDFHTRFTDMKRDKSYVDFTDLEHMTLAVLSDTDLSALERDRFDAVFVDEYQDVSAIQEAILNGLKREGGAPQYYFYVGDVKQSIYRFRLAEPTLFLTKQREFSTAADAPKRLITLNRNFRSVTTVLKGVNRVFEHVMDSRVTEIDYDEAAHLVPGSDSVGDLPIELHLLDSEELTTQTKVIAEATFIARDILARIGEPVADPSGEPCGTLKYRDIAVLTSVSRGVADKVEQVFRSMGIPIYCEGAADSMQSEEVGQVLTHLRLLDNLMDDVALISELRGPLFELSESELSRVRLLKPQREASYLEALRYAAEAATDERLRARCADALQTLARERELLNSMTLDEYIWDFIQRSGLYAHYGAQEGGRQRLANLRLLCGMAGDHERSYGEGLHGFLASVSDDVTVSSGLSPTIVNPWEDVVRLMTIHKSKGLEFPVVYVMGMGRALQGRGASSRLSYHQSAGLSLQYVNELARTRRSTVVQSAIDMKKRAEERAERARLLYVAMTRAKRRLVMLGCRKNADFGYDDALSAQRGEISAEGVYAVRSAGSMLDWLLQCIRPWDEIEERDFSTSPPSVRQSYTQLSELSSAFPQFDVVFRVVFHIAPSISTLSHGRQKVKLDFPLVPSDLPERYSEPRQPSPLYEPPIVEHQPLKLGVTALCAMLDKSGAGAIRIDDEEETVELKRLPYQLERPKLLSSVPELPEFLRPTGELHPLARGTATHKLLSIIDLDGARACASGQALSYVKAERDRLLSLLRLTPEEAREADCGMIARFLTSDMGARMLASPLIKREWRFNLIVSRPTILQGIIDLCFLERGGWVLADFKTDAVKDASELYARYERQLDFYRLALERLTPYPVRECALYSLSLGAAVTKPV